MIKVTDVGGREKYVNSDLIEKIELVPDTLIVLINGNNFIVREKPGEIVERIVEFRRRCSEAIKTSSSHIPVEELRENNETEN